jgi:hypothetical protein
MPVCICIILHKCSTICASRVKDIAVLAQSTQQVSYCPIVDVGQQVPEQMKAEIERASEGERERDR